MPNRHSPEPDLASVAALIGEPARAAMLLALLDGRTMPASELAYRAGVSPTAGSTHLAKLVGGGLLTVASSGRYRFYRLAGCEVADAIERLATIARPPRIVALDQNRIAGELREARSCYDHLAGRLGVAVTDALVARGAIVQRTGEVFDVTQSGVRVFARAGIDVPAARRARRHFARSCRDWSERRPHLAGALGASLHARFLTAGWLEKTTASRALRITADGRLAFAQLFAIELEHVG